MSEQIKKIEAGTAKPQKIWTGEENIQSKIETELAKAKLQKGSPDRWEEQKKYSHRREFVDLSSFGLSHQGQRLKSLEKITYIINSHAKGGFQKATLYMNMKLTTMDNQEYFSFSNGSLEDPALEIIAVVQPFLSGKQFEEDMTAMKADKLLEDHWQNKDQDWRLVSNSRKAYYDKIHPAIASYAYSIIEHLMQDGNKDRITILDVAGGNGDLGERILKKIQGQLPDLRVMYRLIDYSQKDVSIANERFGSLLTQRIDALAVSKDMLSYEFNADKMKADQDLGLPKDGVDLVINSGGLLNNSITDDPQVCVKFNKMYSDLMTEGGFGVYSGLTPLLINATHHKEIGLEIRNLYDTGISHQMHVVRRPKIEV